MATRKPDDDAEAKPKSKKLTRAEAEAGLKDGTLGWREYIAAVNEADD